MKRKRLHTPRKAGLPPGTLIHVGEIKIAQPSITLIEYDDAGLEEHTFTSVELSRQYAPTRSRLWLNVYGLQDPAILGEIGRRFQLHPLVLEDILNTHQRSKIEEYDNYLYCVVRLFHAEAGGQGIQSDQISLVLGERFVLTFQERPSGAFHPVRERLRANHSPMRSHGVDYLAYALLDAVVDSYFGVVDHVGSAAEDLEDDALDRPTPALLRNINLVKQDTRTIRRAVWPLREVMANLLRGENAFFAQDTRLYLRDVYDHTIHLVESLDAVRDLLGDILDIYMSSISNRLNLEVRILTVLSMLFMPATLVAGIFGMNFRWMPLLDQANGFWISLGLMGTLAVAMGLAFWRRRLLRE
ncbi:MAG: magnesium/cobalt transporter CorA [Zoogloeaceae bacterium]|nr:magnesium/cobalt transporter CorA [Zoogloeaceae bacterium]